MARILEDISLRSKRWVFKDRAEAGRRLVPFLKRHADKEAVLLAIPSGGVPVGLEVATAMSIPFDMVIVRKIPIPENPEAGFGALTLEGDVFLSESLVHALRLTPSQIDASLETVRRQVETRNRLFRENRPPASVRGRTSWPSLPPQ